MDITETQILKNNIIPIYSKALILKSKKLKDFNDWSIVVLIYYFGYLLLPEGKFLITDIKSHWNNFRLSTHYLNKIDKLAINSSFVKNQNEGRLNFDNRLKSLFLIPYPYEIKNGIRDIRGTNKFINQSLNFIVIYNLNNRSIFSSITECSNALNI